MDVRARFESDDVTWLRGPDSEVEAQWIERKESARADELARQVSAMANGTPPAGLIVLGAKKDGTLTNVAGIVDARLEELKTHVDTRNWEHRRVVAEGKTLLYLYVPYSADRVVCTSKGKAFRRIGRTTHELKDEELREQRYARGERTFEDELCCPYGEALLDPGLVERWLAAIRDRNGLTLPLDLSSALTNKKLIRSDDRGPHLTNASILALGKDPIEHFPGARLRFVRFDGREELLGTQRNVTKDRFFEGAVPRIVEQFREFMKTLVREFDFLGPEGVFVSEPEYPEFAWEEAVVNALTHRSYSMANVPVHVRMFDDRIEVESPGGFPGMVSAENLYSFPRNPRLGEVLLYLGLVRFQREGTRRMRSEMEALGLPPPEFQEVDDRTHVRVTLRNDIDRRRLRQGDIDVRAKWEEVARLLRDDLPISWREGVRLWSSLASSRLTPPSSVVEAAATVIRAAHVPYDLAHSIIQLLRSAPRSSTAALAASLASDVAEGSFSRLDVAQHLDLFLGEMPEAAEKVLERLEQRVEPRSVPAETLERAFGVLRTATIRSPLPPRAWIDRVIAICVAFSHSRSAQSLHEQITGKPLAPHPAEGDHR